MSDLQLTTQADPWDLSFGCSGRQLRPGSPVIPASSPVRCRKTRPIRTPAAPYQVTRVREAGRTGGAFAVVLETDHPDGLTAAVEIRPGGDNTIAVLLRIDGAAVISQLCLNFRRRN